MTNSPSNRIWTVAEAKAKLSEVLRLAEEEGPQRIGTRKHFVVIPASVWAKRTQPREHLGRWLVENMPRGTHIEIPVRGAASHREIPFADWDDEEWHEK